MSDDEKMQNAGRTFESHKAARQDLAHLRCKARRLLDSIENVRLLLGEKRKGRYEDGQIVVNTTPDNNLLVTKVEWPTDAEIGAVINGLNAGKSEVADLESQLREMGFQDYLKNPAG